MNRGHFDSIGRFHVYSLPTSSSADTFVQQVDLLGKFTKTGKSTFLSGTDAQTLTAGTNTLTISGGNTVNLNRKVDSSYFGLNAGRDSLVFNNVINGTTYRTAVRDSSGGGGGGSLSGLTAATASNSIDNLNFKQRWNFSTLA